MGFILEQSPPAGQQRRVVLLARVTHVSPDGQQKFEGNPEEPQVLKLVGQEDDCRISRELGRKDNA